MNTPSPRALPRRRIVVAAVLAGFVITTGGIAAYTARADSPAPSATRAAPATQVDTAEVIHRDRKSVV